MKGLIVIENNWSLFEGGVQEVDVIGVAENMVEARRMRDEYFGSDIIITKVKDVRDSGLEYIEEYKSKMGDTKGILVYSYFNLNEI